MISTTELRTLTGKNVIGADGEKIGKVSDVYEATDGSGPTFATVNTGMFGTSSSFFPLNAAEVRGDDVVVPFSKDFVKDAPRVENDEELTAPEEQRLYEYYEGYMVPATGTVDVDVEAAPATTRTTEGGITRSEEELHVDKEKVQTGKARLRKYVVTDTETVNVPVSHEEVRIEREPISKTDAGDARIGEDAQEVVLTEERPTVHKETVPVERVNLSKEKVVDQERVSDQVRKEKVDIEGADAYPAEEGARRPATERR